MIKARCPRCCVLVLILVGVWIVPVFSEVMITMERQATLVELPDPPAPVDLYGIIANTGSDQVELTGELSTDQPASWLPAGICIGEACFPSDTPFQVQLSAGAEDTFHVSLFPYQDPGKGFFHFSLVDDAVGDSIDIELLAGTSALLVDDDGGDDFETFIEGLPSFEEGGFLTWNQALEPLSTEELDVLDHIIWLTGNVTTPLSPQEADVIGAFLTSGGKALLSGENILAGDAAEVLGRDFLGAEVQSTSVTCRRVHGVADGPVPESVEFDIEGGTGADNQIEPDALMAVGSGRVTLNYESTGAAAIRRILFEAGRSVVCGFGLEAVSDPETLEVVMSGLLEWLDSMEAPVSPPNVALLMIHDVRPNPSRGTLALSLSAPKGMMVDIGLADLSGRLVAHLYDGPWENSHLSVAGIPNGTYFLIVAAGGVQAQTPIVVLGE